MKILIKVRNWFFSRKLRELFLLCSIIWVLVIIFGISTFKSISKLSHEKQLNQKKIDNQLKWLSKTKEIESHLTELLKHIDVSKTYSQTQLVSHVEQLIKKVDLRYSMDNPGTRAGDLFDVHTLKVHFENASIQKLMELENLIVQEKPYLGIDNLQITTNDEKGMNLSATISLTSLQIKNLKPL